MRHFFAIALFCTPAALTARDTCISDHVRRGAVTRVLTVDSELHWPGLATFELSIL